MDSNLPQRSIEDAEKEAMLVGFRYGDGGWDRAVDLARRGFWAWEIAAHFDLSTAAILALGGPPAALKRR